MEEDRVCNEYVIGFCTRQAFYNPLLTQKCTKLHDSGRKCSYDENRVYGFETKVYKDFRNILAEIERKIKNKNQILMSVNKVSTVKTPNNNEQENKKTNKMDDIMKMLDRLDDELIANLEENKFNFHLHKIYGELLILLQNSRPIPADFFVCGICSNLVAKNESCEHPFHKEYKKLKEITEKLSKKLNIK